MAFTAKILSASNNIPTAFDETAGSLAASAVPAGRRLLVLNYTSEILMVSVGEYSAAPSSTLATNRNQIPVPAASSGNPGYTVLDEVLVGNQSKIYVRTEGSAASSGNVYFSTWKRD